MDPVNVSNNTARNSHRTPDILKRFKEAFTHLKSLVQGEYLRLRDLRTNMEEEKVEQVGSEPRQESSSEAGAEGGLPAKLGKESVTSSAGESAADHVGDASRPAKVSAAQEAQQERQQDLLPAGARAASGRSAADSTPSVLNAEVSSGSPRVRSSPSPASAEDGEKADASPPAKLFFTSMDLIEHFLDWKIEQKTLASAELGASRPGMGREPSKDSDGDAKACAGSKAAI